MSLFASAIRLGASRVNLFASAMRLEASRVSLFASAMRFGSLSHESFWLGNPARTLASYNGRCGGSAVRATAVQIEAQAKSESGGLSPLPCLGGRAGVGAHETRLRQPMRLRARRRGEEAPMLVRNEVERVWASSPSRRGAQGTDAASSHRRVSGADGFGYFCRNKSDPPSRRKHLILLIQAATESAL